MKLYTSPNSPFSARIKLAAMAKGIELEGQPLPAGGLRSEEFLKLNPIAKIPVLLTKEDQAISESTTILRYLEDCYPQPSILPIDPAERARVNGLIAIVDTYIMDPVIRLFSHLDPSRRDDQVIAAELVRWNNGAGWLAQALSRPLPTAEAGLTMADCVIAPSIHLSVRIAAMLGLDADPLRSHAAVRDYEIRMQAHSLVGPVLDGLTHSQHGYDLKAGRPSVAHHHLKSIA